MSSKSLSRRRFLTVSGSAAGGLLLGFYVPLRQARGAVPEGPFAPNAFVRIAEDGTVTVLVNKSEMGQGVYTSLPMLIAEELDADWERIRVEPAPAEPAYNHLFFGMYLTGGSTSIASSWQQFRKAGATARAMLVQAAAARWDVPAGELRTDNGHVLHAGGEHRASYGELALDAAQLSVPENVPLKDPKDFRLIGTNVKRIEGRSKVDGTARFGLDVRLPGMLTGVVARPPVCGGKLKRYDASQAEAIDGVVKVKPLRSGVAVLAKDFWTAVKGREALEIEWDEGPHSGLSTEDIRQEYRKLLEQPGAVAEDHGDAEGALAGAARTLNATYEVPYLAHAPMEPPNCTARVSAEQCDIWAGTQFQTNDQRIAAQILGLKPEQIRIHTELLGGGFGRRANPASDFVADAVEAAKGEDVPVKVVWTREEDIRCGYFRPLFAHQLSAGLDDQGWPVAWKQRIAGQSIAAAAGFEFMIRNGIDPISVEGAVEMPYAIPHRRVELHSTSQPVQVLWWRSVGHTHTAFANECFLDELAHAGGHDPFEYRRKLLAEQPRHRKVLELAAEKAGWGRPLPEGRARGIAMRKSFQSFVAEVAEVSLEEGRPRVHRVVTAIDCGIAINPWNIEAQVESAIVYGLTAALHGEVTLEKGRVQQSNFHDYEMLRLDQMPQIEVHVVPSSEPPTGVGEPGTPPIAPAVANALFALTGERVRRLPIRLSAG